MRKLIFILFFGFCSCKTGFDSSSKKCIEKEHRKTLEKAVESFDMKLEERYKKLSKEAAYIQFLSDWAYKKLPFDFFQDSLELKIRNLNLWEESERSERNMELEKVLFDVDSMNPVRVKLNSEFSTCLSKNTRDWDGTRSFLLANSKYRLSPRLALKNLYHSNENDLKEFENRLAIVLGVYYQTMFNIKNTVANNGYNP